MQTEPKGLPAAPNAQRSTVAVQTSATASLAQQNRAAILRFLQKKVQRNYVILAYSEIARLQSYVVHFVLLNMLVEFKGNNTQVDK